MGRTQITSNTKEFTRRLTKVGEKLNINILTSLTESIDEARFRAGDKFLIPSKVKIERVIKKASGPRIPLARKGNRLVALSELQPPHPSKLTSRLGVLHDILTSPGKWRVTKRLARLKAQSKHLNFTIRPQFAAGKISYFAKLVLTEKGDKDIKFRLDQELGRTRSRKKRPFFEPALQIQTKSILPDIKKLAKSEFDAKL